MTAIGRRSCGTSSPYWTEMSRARAAYSAPSAQRPAQNSTQARPQSARELLGSSRSRHSSYSRSSRRGPPPLRERCEGVHDRQRRLPHELLATDRAREVAGACGRSSGASASPANHFRMACTARARRRSTSSSSCSASSRAARAWSDDGLKRVAHASRQWISDRSAGEEVSRKASSSRGQSDRRSPARQGGQEPRRAGNPLVGPQGDRRESCVRASTRPRSARRAPQRAPDDAGRCGRPAASAEARARRVRRRRRAPRVLARVAACSRSAATSGSDSSSRARGDGPGRAGRSRSLRSRPCARRRSPAGALW